MEESNSDALFSVIVELHCSLLTEHGVKTTMLSCNGILLNSSLVLTSASFLAPLYFGNDDLSRILNSAVLDGVSISNKLMTCNFGVTLTLPNSVQEEGNDDFTTYSFVAEFLGLKCIETIKKDLNKILIEKFTFGDQVDDDIYKNLLSSFIMLKIVPRSDEVNGDGVARSKQLELNMSDGAFLSLQEKDQKRMCHDTTLVTLQKLMETTTDVQRGDTVWLDTNLFGDCHPVFTNVMSKGVVSSVYGTIFLMDTHLSPGSEGSLVYCRSGLSQEKRWAGIVLAPLCWKNRYLTGFSLACSARSMLANISNTGCQKPMVTKVQDHSSRLASGLKSIVMVKVGNSWGSGIVVDKSQGIILTCSHVTKSALEVEIKAHYPEIRSARAKVLYQSPNAEIYDVAVLQLIDSIPIEEVCYQRKPIIQGQAVYALGYGLFSNQSASGVLFTTGTISQVLSVKKIPVLLQTTCNVQGGDSGGAVVDAHTGNFVGMIVLNTRDGISGINYPNINFSIPADLLMATVRKFLWTKDIDVLSRFHISHPIIKKFWSLSDRVYQKSKL